MNIRYAVLFKVHYWDDFAARRLQHLLRKTTGGDVFVFVDETHGPVPEIPHDRVIRVTERDMTALDTVLYPKGKVFWYNVDYPLYYLYLRERSYDYYLMSEHDAVFNIDVDKFVDMAHATNVDYVGFPLTKDAWPLLTCEGVYPATFKIENWLSCISLHSRRSVEFLLKRRRELGRRYDASEIKNWPNNEAFLPTEMQNNDFVVRTLGDFGKVDRYSWWPPTHERDLPLHEDQAFLHPVLDERRYVASCVRESNLISYFSPGSELRKMLRRASSSALPAVLDELTRRTVRQVTPTPLLQSVRRFRARNAGAFRRFLRRMTPAG